MLLHVTKVRKMRKKKLDRKGKVKRESSIKQRRGFLGPSLSLERDPPLMWVYF